MGLTNVTLRHLVKAQTFVFFMLFALNASTQRSMAVAQVDSWGMSTELQGALLALGAFMVLLGNEKLFILGTLPYALHAAVVVHLVIEARAGYGTGLAFAFTWTQIVLLYWLTGGDD